MIRTLQFRRGTSAQWTAKNPILSAGEPGFETDTRLFKIGNGTSHWDELPYFIDGHLQESLTEAMIEEAIANSGGAGSDPRIGNMGLLTTTNKSTVVAAINEVDTPPVSLSLLYANAKA